ncbi:MAG TPA: DUF4397 domain-containing protein [Gammaproteobacteria bacterium]|nr:DUF4397 domain-containing protein [Gammaproteobacteria bacterium]
MPSRTSLLSLAAGLFLALAATSCSEGRKPPPKTTVEVVNSAPTQGTLNFRREQRVETTLDFGASSTPLVFDEDQYDFNVTTTPPGASADTLLDTFSEDVVHGTDYLFVVTEEGGTVEHLIFEKPAFSSTTQAEAVVVHAAASQPPIDLYLTAAGTDITTASPIGSVSFKQGSAPVDLDAGDYVLTVTAAGDPSHVLMTFAPVTVAAGNLAFVITDGTGDGLVPFSVVMTGPDGGQFFDMSTPSGLELVNAAADNGARDIFLDGDFTSPIYAAVPSPGATAQTIVAPGERKLSVTPAGNPGVIEVEQTFTAVPGRRQTQLLAGNPGSLTFTTAQDDPRPIVDQSRVRFMNAATLFTAVNVYIVPPGTDISTALPVTSLTVPAISSRVALPPGTYDVVVTASDTGAVIAGPQSVTVSGSGLYTILVTNGADGSTASIVPVQGFD